jgi:hypothetical protein
MKSVGANTAVKVSAICRPMKMRRFPSTKAPPEGSAESEPVVRDPLGGGG